MVSPEPTDDEKREQLRKSLGITSFDNTFESLKPWPGTEEAVAAYKELAEGTSDWNMLLEYGGVGNGKSHHCEAAVLRLRSRGVFSRVLLMDAVAGVFHQCIGDEKQYDLETVIHNYSYSERLILDDVECSKWEYEQLEKIIRVRYHERLFTILTTNRDLEELPERIVSRFRDREVGRLILNEGADYRGQK